jgi:hypothetical protein
MKPIFALAALFVSALAFADPAPAPTIASEMKQISALVKQISAAISDSTKDAQTAALAAELPALFATCQGLVPDAIASLPADQQAAAIADYKSLLQNEIDDANKLTQDLQAGDNADAATVLADMNSTKKEGHGKYNP